MPSAPQQATPQPLCWPPLIAAVVIAGIVLFMLAKRRNRSTALGEVIAAVPLVSPWNPLP
jgi:hypothetical protein